MMKRLSPILMIFAVGLGMPGETIWQGNITLSSSRPLVIVPRKPLSAPGPTHELCVIPRERGVDASGDSLLTLHGAVHLRVLLFGPDGQIDSLYRDRNNWNITKSAGHRDSVPVGLEPPSVDEFRPEEFCTWTHNVSYGVDSSRTIVRVELYADRALTIHEVKWWSGRRQPRI
jgi:hypothetical protein